MATQLEWQIIDDTGVIHSGTSEEMDSAWDVMICSSVEEYLKMLAEIDLELVAYENIEALVDTFNKYHCEFKGDLKLIEVHKTFR